MADHFVRGRLTDGGSRLYRCRSRFFWPLPGFRRGLREVLTMWEIIVGLIGIALIVYLLVAVIRPEKF
jgi:K+-transporting ATPase KdpF subunit